MQCSAGDFSDVLCSAVQERVVESDSSFCSPLSDSGGETAGLGGAQMDSAVQCSVVQCLKGCQVQCSEVCEVKSSIMQCIPVKCSQ